MRLIAALLIFLCSACQPNPYPYRATAKTFKDEKPFIVNLTTGQDKKEIPPDATIIITGEIDKEMNCWPVIYQTDTGYIYPKFVHY